MSSSILTSSDSQHPHAIKARRPSKFQVGLRGRLTLTAIALAVTPVLSVGGLLYGMTGQSIARRSAQEQIVQTQLAAAAVHDVLRSRYQSATAISGLAVFTDPTLRQQTTTAQKKQVLDTFLQRTDGVENIAFLSNGGQLLFQADSDQPLSTNVGQQAFVERALENQRPTMSPFTASEDAELQVDFAAPVLDANSNQVIGLIYLRMPGRTLQFALESLQTEAPTWFLVNPEAQIVAGSEPDSLGQSADNRWSEIAAQVAAQKPDSGFQRQPGGRRALLSYAPLPLSDDLPQQTLGVLLSTEVASTLTPANPLLWALLLGTGISAIAAAVLASIVAQKLTQPIHQVSAAIAQLRKGNFDINVQIHSDTELDNLGNSLNNLGQYLNQQLDSTYREYTHQQQLLEQQWTQEYEQLQADILRIGQVLAALQVGNWSHPETVTNSEATAPAAIALNQMVQALGEVLGSLLDLSDRVTQRVDALKTGTTDVLKLADQQQQASVEACTALSQVESSSQNTRQQALSTHETLEKTQFILTQGRQDLNALVDNVDELQQGTTQIVQRPKTLAEFVDLAAQFSKEQKRVAAQTRVLALNASMLASRASSQQDPGQFASVAHEFETIAQQINDLAVEANQNLILLKQRSDQIQTVISGLDQDAQNISDMVSGVTSQIGQFQETFKNLHEVNTQTQQLVESVAQFSESATQSAQTATAQVQSLEVGSKTVQHQVQRTQQEADQAQGAAAALQSQLQFFQLFPSED
ncbi:cache domain-containing protein [Oscillatoria sp. CS-180]|uniref:cache domain-containing protein n=1 Tax=Oscillatoria sp. CS-180 TaxID=3021720 RepID=UPI002330F446|nr:HAMP domain-containing protein [Oscillatoria sp. CS-180]MDB9525283.1 cache domain-containing protein [Oscillatoria sp. CS-180]